MTSALPYANGPIHFGHIAGAYLPADIYVRLRRGRGHRVVYICGTDEHGVAITLSARQAGVTPRDHVDRWHREIKAIFRRFNIDFDHFSRTSTPRHAAVSQGFFRNLLEKDLVTPADSEQLFCPRDAMFLPDRYVTGICPACGFEAARGDECPQCGAWIDPLKLRRPSCKLCGARPEKRTTRHWYLRLDSMQPRLESFISQRRHWKRNVLRFVDGLLREGLQPRPVTRDLDWGVPVPLPEAAGKVIYVWFDAPLGYITATQEWAERAGTPEEWRAFWQDSEAQIVHFIGKDNIPFHCLTFPAMLMGQDAEWNLARDVPANEFFNLEGGKFNTSTGWYIDLDAFFSKYSTDMIRWAITRNLPETADAEFTWSDFQAKVNGELADIYGNLAHRVQTFIHRAFQGVVPPAGPPSPEDVKLEEIRRQAPGRIAAAVESFRIREGAVHLMDLARAGNRYFDAVAPWTTQRSDPDRCGATLNRCVALLETLAVLTFPFLPGTARRLFAMLGQDREVAGVNWDEAARLPDPAGRSLRPPAPLFQKIDDHAIEQEVAALHRQAAGREQNLNQEPSMNERDAAANTDGLPGLRPQITLEDFQKCDLRLGRIVEAEPVSGSKKLLRFTVDIGLDRRTILAGIQENYAPENLLGKTVVVIANLASRRMMGFDSQGMILAAEADGKLTVLVPLTEGLPPGARLS